MSFEKLNPEQRKKVSKVMDRFVKESDARNAPRRKHDNKHRLTPRPELVKRLKTRRFPVKFRGGGFHVIRMEKGELLVRTLVGPGPKLDRKATYTIFDRDFYFAGMACAGTLIRMRPVHGKLRGTNEFPKGKLD